MGRDAVQMSVVPLMSAAMPVPEPPPVTWMTAPGCEFMYNSAQRWARITMVSEPLTVMPRPAWATPTPARASTPSRIQRIDFIECLLPLDLELRGPQVVLGVGVAAARHGDF